jgi:antitoxin HigA-1
MSMAHGALRLNSRTGTLIGLISSNTTKEADMVYVAKRSPKRCPTHPGALLREDIIPATGKTVAGVARLLGISRQHLYDIVHERKPVTPEVAVLLGKLFGDGAGVWTRMQAAHDTWHAEREVDASKVKTLEVA